MKAVSNLDLTAEPYKKRCWNMSNNHRPGFKMRLGVGIDRRT